MFSWFAFFRGAGALQAPVPPSDLDAIADTLRAIGGAREARIFTPAPIGSAHPFPNDEPPPMLALQLHFATIAELEAPLIADGPLAGIAELPSLRGAAVHHQAMAARSFPVPDRLVQPPPGELPCSYLVHYPGAADDLPAWNKHYIRNHPPLMARFPGVRDIELYTGIDWISDLPWPLATAFQRNKLVFDSAAALSAGLLSPAIKDMRADFHQFPAFSGGNVHYPMLTRTVKS